MVSRSVVRPAWKPGPEELTRALGKRVHDVIAPGLSVLFVGINPGLYSGAVGHHFARPGNRFWPVLLRAGFTDRLLSPFGEQELLRYGCGITNIVNKATAAASDLTKDELVEGARRLEAKIRRYRPALVAVLGLGAYRVAFSRPRARFGPQEEKIAGVPVWVLPNPSGLNAGYQLADLTRMFRRLRKAAGVAVVGQRPKRQRGN